MKSDANRTKMFDILTSLTGQEDVAEPVRPPVNRKRAATLAIGIGTVAATLLAGAVAVRSRASSELDRNLSADVAAQVTTFTSSVQRTRATTLLTAQDPTFQEFYRQSSDREATIAAGGPLIGRIHTVLNFLEVAYPDRIGEVCFIDIGGAENARVVKGAAAGPDGLSPDESQSPFFAATAELKPGEVYLSRPYLSPDTGEWVVSHSTPIVDDAGETRAMFHVELTLEGLRMDWANRPDHRQLYAIDATTGAVVVDSEVPQAPGGDLGRPRDVTFRSIARGAQAAGLATIGDQRVAFQRVDIGSNNDNDWYLVAADDSVGFWSGRSLVVQALTMLALALVATLMFWGIHSLVRPKRRRSALSPQR